MEEEQLKLLEKRINNAISFIEKLKSREKLLIREKDELIEKNIAFERSIEEKDKKIETLKESQRFLREKIEVILVKLESLAGIEEVHVTGTESELEVREFEMEVSSKIIETESESIPSENIPEEVIVEEKIIDLEQEKKGMESLFDENDINGSDNPDPSKDKKSIVNLDDKVKEKWLDNNPFIEI